MCGIAGFAFGAQKNLSDVLSAMTDKLSHRGPDGAGTWIDEQAQIYFGHRRLAIVDLSLHGQQPMHSNCGRYVITYNGEIYNFKELQQTLKSKGYVFQSDSDTEVLLSAISCWGVLQTLQECDGMFAFAIWDKQEKTLYLARDRFGEKPLYYGWINNTLVFASELKALREFPGFNPAINRDAVTLYLKYGYVPTPHTIYQDIHKLPPGHLFISKEKNANKPVPQAYWSLANTIERSSNKLLMADEPQLIKQGYDLLKNTVANRMMGDVSSGALLSGGIDSSLITLLMQANSQKPIKTFTVGFAENAFNEATIAKEVAELLGTDHAEIYVQHNDVLNIIPQLTSIYDEPFADSSQIPTYLVAKLARQEVTMCLSGDGGDELFGGYNRYLWGNRLWQMMQNVPHFFRNSMSKILLSVTPGMWDKLFSIAKQKQAGDKIHKVAQLLKMKSKEEAYHFFITCGFDAEKSMPKSFIDEAMESFTATNFSEWMMYLDAMSYLPDDVLTKVDRASMHAGIEIRAPFLDPKVVEFAWQLPSSMKMRGSEGKWLLRKILQQHLPAKLIDRPKMGFGVPLADWLRGPLRPWAEELLCESSLQQQNFFSPKLISDRWREHLSGKRNWQHSLWVVLMLQAWLREHQ